MQNIKGFDIVIPIDRVLDRRTCGSKALTLGRIARRGFVVPDAFCIGSDAYRAHLWASGARELARMRPDLAGREAVRKAILDADLPRDVMLAVESAYRALGEDIAVAVRHSAQDERVAGKAYRTVVGVRGLSEVVRAVKEVWASLWTEEAAALREQRAVWREPSMAVIVQAVVDAKVSGTATTADITTGNPNVVVVESALGMFSDDTPMDRMCVDLGDFTIVDAKVARKELSDDAPALDAPSLSPDQAIEVAEAVLWVQRSLGGVRSVQWAHDGENFLILGTKPVGSLPRYSPSGECIKPLWRLTSIEPVSFLAQSLSVYRAESLPSLPSAGGLVAVRCKDGRAYRRLVRPQREEGKLAAFRDVIASSKLQRKWRRAAEKILRESRRALAADTAKLSDRELSSAVQRALLRAETSMQWFEAISYPSVRFAYLLREALASVGAKSAVLSRLVRQTDATRLEQDIAFQRLSAYAWDSRDGESTALDEMAREIGKRFGYAFKGSRDVRDPSGWRSWAEDPRAAVEIASVIAQGPETDVEVAYGKAMEDTASVEREVLAAIRTPMGRIRFRLLLKRTRAWLGAGSEKNAVHALALSALRAVLLEMGRRLESSGALSSSEDIFYLTCDEVTRMRIDMGEPAKAEMHRTIAHRKHELWLLGRLTPPSWVPGTGEDASGPRTEPVILSGIPCSPGEATGPARVALSYKDVMALRPGEILIAEDVGPAWAPLLSLAGGIVMARGDLLSPGAVAARDYGIPCVYGASGVTSAVRTGQIVRVDGSSGAVVKVTGR